jgi:cytosine/uracil/thiamine/allantoin permease
MMKINNSLDFPTVVDSELNTSPKFNEKLKLTEHVLVCFVISWLTKWLIFLFIMHVTAEKLQNTTYKKCLQTIQSLRFIHK